MEPFKYHVFICDQQKPEGAPSCPGRRSDRVIELLRKEIAIRGLLDDVQVTTCGSLGLCESGPNMVVYPEGIWYCGIKPEDVVEIVRSHFEEGLVVERLAQTDTSALRAGILSNRAKMLAAARAREAAGAIPEDLMQNIRGFQESRVILTAVELNVFTAVGQGTSAESVARTLGTNARATEMLMNALVALGLLTKSGVIFHNSPLSQRYFADVSPDFARPGLMHIVHLWKRWSTLTDCVRAGTAVSQQEPAERGEDWTQAFIAAMDRNAAERAPLVVKAIGTQGVKRMLDVGGGSAAYSIAFARASEDLRVDLLDLFSVIPIAQSNIERGGLAERIATRAGDLRSDSLGRGYDLVFVSQICHMLSLEENQSLVDRCWAATAQGGRTVIQDFILEPDKTAPKSAALFALNMLVGTRAGSTYSAEEYKEWMKRSGFPEVKHVRLPGPSSLIMGTR